MIASGTRPRTPTFAGGRDPLALLPVLAAEANAAWLAVPDPEHPVTLLAAGPCVELRVDPAGRPARSDGAPAPSDPLEAIADFVATAPAFADLPFPAAGGVVGYLAYELGHFAVPRIAARAPDVPLAVLRRYETLLVHSTRTGAWRVFGPTVAWLDRLRRAAAGAPSPARSRHTPPARALHPTPRADAPLGPCWPRAAYRSAVARIHEHLLEGDIYQANLTLPFATPLDAPAWALCQRLARDHPVPYVAYLDLGRAQVIVNSPELFLRARGGTLETRPIKGTRPRGVDPAADAAAMDQLRHDEKERAEHVMIVDLERNDLGRVCEAGSVQVDGLMRVESHPSIHHLVSRIRGTRRPDVGLAELLRATFPGGSVTGAPKQRAMQILAALEPTPRGVYCGALGCFAPDGDLELALTIRTAIVAGGEVRWHAGGGIVVDSDPEREWAEAWLKTAALRRALGEPERPAP